MLLLIPVLEREQSNLKTEYEKCKKETTSKATKKNVKDNFLVGNTTVFKENAKNSFEDR